MNFNEDDINQGFKDCDRDGCNHRHILEAGTDYPKEKWTMCKSCECWVVEVGR